MTAPANRTWPLCQEVCKLFVVRAEAHPDLGKGIKRDTAALESIIGAANAAQALKDDEFAGHLTKVAFLVSVRGYAEVKRIAEDM